MNYLAVTFLFGCSLLVVGLTVNADQDGNWIDIPKGEVAAFWLSPVSTKTKQESTIQKIQVDAFKILKYPVTIQEFGAFLEKNPAWKSENISKLFKDESYLKDIVFSKSNARQPITSVSWFAAKAYCESVNARLPLLNEWEYVAAASESQKNANNDEKFLQRILNWYGEPKGVTLKPVGSIYKNLYGAWDLHGLIWEWVDDFNTSFVTGESREDSSFNKDMFCGAGALSSADKENYAGFMRFAFRSGLRGQSSVWNLGFRCVRVK